MATVIKRYNRRYIKHYHDYIGNFKHFINILCSSVGKQQYINVSLIRYKYFFFLMQVRLGQVIFFTYNKSVCACVCVCVLASVHKCMFILAQFQIQLISHALAGSVSIGAAVGVRCNINHHWLNIFLCRDLL